MLTKRTILDRVAKGDLDPREAIHLLEELDEPTTSGPATARATVPGSRCLRLEVELSTVSIVGDPTVATVDVSGSHELSVDGDTTTVRCTPEEDPRSFVALSLRARGRRRDRHEVHVRVNPRLELDVEVAAGKVSVRQVHAPIRAKVELGQLVIDDFVGPVDLEVQAGSIVARGRLDHGASTARCELGRIRIELDPASSVEITGSAEVGAVVLPDGVRIAGLSTPPDGTRSVTLGDGTGTLAVSAAAGKVEVLA